MALFAGVSLLGSPGPAMASHSYHHHFDVYAYDASGHLVSHGWGDLDQDGTGRVTLNNAGIKDDRADGHGASMTIWYGTHGDDYFIANRDGNGSTVRDDNYFLSYETGYSAHACRLEGPFGCGATKTIHF
ncbi:hypothetical protein OG372_00320 [Streptomyces sp. NBC_01020]|uniref:hypothetical protein n=2 Tax=Streptomyces TaxID=1883 RepID=UPI002E2082F5|nr:hypothetical protein OG372_00320 [Streptomyces sp. NBC_01020]